MCNGDETSMRIETERFWHLGRENASAFWPRAVFSRAPGAFIRRVCTVTVYKRELVVGRWAVGGGRWALIPWFAKEPKLKFPTNNARSEELEVKASYKDPWKRGATLHHLGVYI